MGTYAQVNNDHVYDPTVTLHTDCTNFLEMSGFERRGHTLAEFHPSFAVVFYGFNPAAPSAITGSSLLLSKISSLCVA